MDEEAWRSQHPVERPHPGLLPGVREKLTPSPPGEGWGESHRSRVASWVCSSTITVIRRELECFTPDRSSETIPPRICSRDGPWGIPGRGPRGRIRSFPSPTISGRSGWLVPEARCSRLGRRRGSDPDSQLAQVFEFEGAEGADSHGADGGATGGRECLGRARQPSVETGPEPGVPVNLPNPGETLGGFRLVSELGRGAFARVYLAEQSDLGRRLVALKVSRAEGDEPQILARLQHTHIVPIFSVHDDPATRPAADLHALPRRGQPRAGARRRRDPSPGSGERPEPGRGAGPRQLIEHRCGRGRVALGCRAVSSHSRPRRGRPRRMGRRGRIRPPARPADRGRSGAAAPVRGSPWRAGRGPLRRPERGPADQPASSCAR